MLRHVLWCFCWAAIRDTANRQIEIQGRLVSGSMHVWLIVIECDKIRRQLFFALSFVVQLFVFFFCSLISKDPLPPKPWQNVYDATQEKSCSVSESFYLKKVVGSEDCLFLNIFTKETKPKKLQPVLVYIHGGGFNAGSSSIDSLGPDHLLLADVVVVTMNYRLGALGFLSLKNKALDVPGNAALKDQLMAIKFVKKNIENFGGDPANITLFGQSAGGSSVSWHCVSEQSKGLFQKAIIMSGCVLNRFSLTPQRDWAFRLAQKLGYEGVGTDEESILNFLHEADPVEIVRVQDSLLKSDERGKISMPFAPTIEHYETDRTFINGQPLDLARKAWSNRIDILIGGTSDEGLMYLEYIRQSPALMRQLNLGNMIPSELSICGDDPLRTSFAEKLRVAYYPSGTDPTVDEMSFCAVKLCDVVFCLISSSPPIQSQDESWPIDLAWNSPAHSVSSACRPRRQNFSLSICCWLTDPKPLPKCSLGRCARSLSFRWAQLSVQEQACRRSSGGLNGAASNPKHRELSKGTSWEI